MNTGFKKLLEGRVEQHIQLKDFVSLVLDDQAQPLTIPELTILVNRELGRHYDKATIRIIANELVKEGKAVVRTETLAERSLRAGGELAAGKQSAIYFSTAGGAKFPPARTVTEAVEGVRLSPAYERRKYRRRTTAAKSVVTIPAKSVSTDSSDIAQLIEQLVADRTRALRLELDEANAKLEKLKSLLGS